MGGVGKLRLTESGVPAFASSEVLSTMRVCIYIYIYVYIYIYIIYEFFQWQYPSDQLLIKYD